MVEPINNNSYLNLNLTKGYGCLKLFQMFKLMFSLLDPMMDRANHHHKWAYHFDFLDTGMYENSLTALHSQH